MKNKTSLLRWAGLCALVLIAFVTLAHAAQSGKMTKKALKSGRPDVVTLRDTFASSAGKPEMPAVTFLHDQHTQALAAMQKDCGSCHAADPKTGSLAFAMKGTENATGSNFKEKYHAACITCHVDAGKAGKKTGPVAADCRGCHNAHPDAASNRQEIHFNKLLHYKHVSSSAVKFTGNPEKNCGACHHVYDANAKKLVWGKDKEDSCRACHLMPEAKAMAIKANPDASDANGKLATRPTFDKTGHMACVNCHLGVAAKKLPNTKTGPINCAGCHDGKIQAAVSAELAAPNVEASLPRLMRGQPDAALLLPVSGGKGEVKNSMRPVSFNHKFHEGVVSDCRTCHHKKIDACATCHTLEGKKEGGMVNLAGAMHARTSQSACVGCHNSVKQQPSCAGCHIRLPKGMTAESCAKCHNTPVGTTDQEAENGSLLKAGKEQKEHLAADTVAARASQRTTTFDLTDIPEKITIGSLSTEFEASELPHRKIVKALLEKQAESRLGGVFHADKATLCQSCHHHSPPSKTPPKCVSCHSTDGQSAVTGRPALKAAYHLQCMTCHAEMKQKPAATECKDCHKPRKN